MNELAVNLRTTSDLSLEVLRGHWLGKQLQLLQSFSTTSFLLMGQITRALQVTELLKYSNFIVVILDWTKKYLMGFSVCSPLCHADESAKLRL